MPSNTASRKTPLADITQRPLAGRRSNNTAAQAAASAVCSAGAGDENSPARKLLELFAAAQGGSIGRKRSLKLINDDSENYPPVLAIHATTAAKAKLQSTVSPASTVVAPVNTPQEVVPVKSISPLLYNSTKPLSLVWTLSHRQTFGKRRNRPFYGKGGLLVLYTSVSSGLRARL